MVPNMERASLWGILIHSLKTGKEDMSPFDLFPEHVLVPVHLPSSRQCIPKK